MQNVEKVIISESEQIELDRQKQENDLITSVCTRYLEREAIYTQRKKE